jgi:hypothetical protein
MGHLLTKIKHKPKNKNTIIVVQPPQKQVIYIHQKLITIPKETNEELTLERPQSRRSKKRLPNNLMNELF